MASDIDTYSYGVKFATTGSTCTRDGNAEMGASLPIQSQYKGCVVKNGVVQYWLDDNNWAYKKYHGINAGSSGVSAGSSGVTPDESTQETSCLDGTDGDVMVHIPKFYGCSWTDTDNTAHVRINTYSATLGGHSWQTIPEMYISAWAVSAFTDTDGKIKTASVCVPSDGSGRASIYKDPSSSKTAKYITGDPMKTLYNKPWTSRTRAQFRTYANNADKELLNYEYYKWVFYWNYVIEFCNFNGQANCNGGTLSNDSTVTLAGTGGLGAGVTQMESTTWNAYNGYHPLTPCGYTNCLGNRSGKRSMTNGTAFTYTVTSNNVTTTYSKAKGDIIVYPIRWRGFENPFGDIWKILDGVIAINTTGANTDKNYVYTTTDTAVSKSFDSTKDDVLESTFSSYKKADSEGNVLMALASSASMKTLALGDHGEIYNAADSGSSKSDYQYASAATNRRCFRSGGGADFWSAAGFGCLYSNSGVGWSGANGGVFDLVKAS